MPKFAEGGVISGPALSDVEAAKVTIAPEECVVNRDLECVRSDHRHDPAEAEQSRAAVAATLRAINTGA
jgi:hypothetical protein